jgi:hypothetical protein
MPRLARRGSADLIQAMQDILQRLGPFCSAIARVRRWWQTGAGHSRVQRAVRGSPLQDALCCTRSAWASQGQGAQEVGTGRHASSRVRGVVRSVAGRSWQRLHSHFARAAPPQRKGLCAMRTAIFTRG